MNNFGSLDSNFNNFTGLLDQNGGNFSNNNNSFGQNLSQGLIEQPYDFGLPNKDSPTAGAQTMQIRKLYMGLTRPQQIQHRRTYDVYLDGVGHNALSEKIDRYGQDAFTQANLSSVMASADIIKPSGSAEASVGIEGGWDKDRYTFMLVADIFRNGKFQRTEFISGYTDYAGAMNTDLISTVSIDPDMVFTINHISEANMRQQDQMGRPIPMISQTNSVLTNPDYTSFSNNKEDLYMMRPSDILRSVDKVDMHRGMLETSRTAGMTGMSYRDLDSTLTQMPMMSNDTSSLIPTFTGRILNGLYATKLEPFDPLNMDQSGTGAVASQRIADVPFSKNGFVFIMQRMTGNGVQTTSRFTFNDLLRLDASIDDRTAVFGRSYESGQISFPDGRNCAVMGAAETVAVHATMISHSTLALMAMAGITTIGFNANNHSGRTEITWQAVEGMDYDGKLAMRMEAFRARLQQECLAIVSKDDEITYQVDVFASALNDVFIQFRWDGDYREYVFPAFASAVTLPIVTKDLSRLTDLAQSVDDIVGMLATKQQDYTNTHGSSMFASGNGDSRVGGLSGDY